jgi:hypothetical protein
MRKLIIVCTMLALAACTDPKIDGSSQEAAQASIQKVRKSLPDAQRQEFDQAVAQLTMSNLDFKALFTGVQSAEDMAGKALANLNGKTASQVIAEAKALEKTRKDKERQQALAEIEELKAKQMRSQTARAELAKFEVSRSRFRLVAQQFGRPQPVVELSVVNNTSHAIARAYFKGTIASPGRSVPWHSDDFNYSISGGLEPGEKANWNLEPNMFSDWGKVDAPADAVFTVEVERLDGADGKPIFNAREFDEQDAKRMAALLKEHG